MSKHENETGIVLIITLWVIVVLATVSLSYVKQVSLEIKMVGFQRDVAIADALADAGLRQALILLREDRIKDSGENVRETIVPFEDDDVYLYDGGNEAWAENPRLLEGVPFYESGDQIGYYYVDIEDESAKFPINNPATTLEMIAHLLELTGVAENDAKMLAGAIIDWRDADDVPADTGGNTFGRDAADENTFYNSGYGGRGRHIPQIVIKNFPFDSIDELLLLPGMTPQIVYGTVDPDDETGRGRSRRRHRRSGEYLGLKNYVSVYNMSVNINTVKAEVLESLLFPTLADQAEKLATDWTEYRDGHDHETYTEDDQVMKTMDNSDMDDIHFTNVEGFTPEVWTQVSRYLVIASNTFVVTCLAEYEGIEKGYRVVVQRDFLNWQEIPLFGEETNKLEDLEQVKLQVRLFEPVFDAKKRIERMG
ncbi:MAG: hypothetical protein C4527_24385 [Candidatus Omnitrophota bacterium]|jgi:type II secretory pathway component PulK|nr:MAG: hypothetical protein C4527_24385 [Candidatus Omnitrophota bacterium]